MVPEGVTKTYDGEVARVRGALHDEPGDGLLILAVDTAGLDELGLELVDGGWLRVGAQVDGDCVDHRCWWFLLCGLRGRGCG